MKKPNAILHMTGYGLIYGLLLGMLYMWGFFILVGTAEIASIGAIFFTAFYAMIFGGLPGAIMGFVEGCLLWGLTRNLQLPMTQEDFKSQRNKSMAIMGGLTFLGMAAIMIILFGLVFLDLFLGTIFVFLPALIAGGAAAYAVNRYLLKLRAWGNGGIEKAKNKAKNEPRNNLAQDDNSSENTLELPDVEQQAQRKQD